MLNFIFSQILFYAAIALILFVPGYFLMMSVFGKKQFFSDLEKFIFSFSSSIVIINFLMIFIGRLKIPITRLSIIMTILFFLMICMLVVHFRDKKNQEKETFQQKTFSKKQTLAILAIIFLTIFIKTTYLKEAILPTSTDLGHHMYWAKTISVTGQLPTYQETDITENYTVSQPLPIADFIIGEHLIFSAIGLISGIDYVSYFPVLILYLIHIMSLLAIFALALYLFRDFKDGKMISITTLFLIGPIYALSSPQAKFVSGGVIGNTIGNLLIPIVIYFFVRALNEKNSKLLAYAVLMIFGLSYTHHLSTFIFIFIFIFSAIFFAAFNFKKIIPHFKEWMSLILSKQVLSILILGIIFIFILYTPTYLNKNAVDTAVGAPSKATRMGLTMTELKYAAGEARMIFGIIGFALLLAIKKRSSYAVAFILGWFFSITIMSLKPNWLFIDIPSNRIASYIGFPVAILGGFAIIKILSTIKDSEKQYLGSHFLLSFFLVIFTFTAVSGFYDNSQTLNTDGQPESVLQTYRASQYLSTASTNSDIILKDHNYISADSWIKLSFMRGYNYPFSRGYFKRYSDETKPREQCTNLMISNPNSLEAKKCFDGTKTNFLMVNPKLDASQFQKAKGFWQIYSADDIAIFYKSL